MESCLTFCALQLFALINNASLCQLILNDIEYLQNLESFAIMWCQSYKFHNVVKLHEKSFTTFISLTVER